MSKHLEMIKDLILLAISNATVRSRGKHPIKWESRIGDFSTSSFFGRRKRVLKSTSFRHEGTWQISVRINTSNQFFRSQSPVLYGIQSSNTGLEAKGLVRVLLSRSTHLHPMSFFKGPQMSAQMLDDWQMWCNVFQVQGLLHCDDWTSVTVNPESPFGLTSSWLKELGNQHFYPVSPLTYLLILVTTTL